MTYGGGHHHHPKNKPSTPVYIGRYYTSGVGSSGVNNGQNQFNALSSSHHTFRSGKQTAGKASAGTKQSMIINNTTAALNATQESGGLSPTGALSNEHAPNNTASSNHPKKQNNTGATLRNTVTAAGALARQDLALDSKLEPAVVTGSASGTTTTSKKRTNQTGGMDKKDPSGAAKQR